MSAPDDDGSFDGGAFPIYFGPDDLANSPGMSLRDYFAAKALPAIMRHDRWQDYATPGNKAMTPPEHQATAAYLFADAMLKARQS